MWSGHVQRCIPRSSILSRAGHPDRGHSIERQQLNHSILYRRVEMTSTRKNGTKTIPHHHRVYIVIHASTSRRTFSQVCSHDFVHQSTSTRAPLQARCRCGLSRTRLTYCTLNTDITCGDQAARHIFRGSDTYGLLRTKFRVPHKLKGIRALISLTVLPTVMNVRSREVLLFPLATTPRQSCQRGRVC